MFALSDVRFARNSAIVGDVEGQPFFFFFLLVKGSHGYGALWLHWKKRQRNRGMEKKLDKVQPIVAEIYPT